MSMNVKKIFNKISSAHKKSDDTVNSKLDLVKLKPSAVDEKIKQQDDEKNDPFKKSHYSQDGEDIVLASFYEEKPGYKGFYVDVGALNPLRFSNTQYFYEKGWRGINIDATPGSMKEFNEIRLH